MIEKAPDAYRTISEVGEDLDLPQHVLRFWETRFSQIKPLKRGGGRRYYRPDDVELLKGIRHLLYSEGYTIKGVQRILKEQGPKSVQALAPRAAPEAPAAAAPPVVAEAPAAKPAPPAATQPARPVEIPVAEPPAGGEVPAWLAQPSQAAPQTSLEPPRTPSPPLRPAVQTPDLFGVELAPPVVRAPVPTVAYTRGGLKPVAPSAEGPAAASDIVVIRKQKPADAPPPVEAPHETAAAAPEPQPAAPAPVAISGERRRALQAALFELTECRRAIAKISAAAGH